MLPIRRGWQPGALGQIVTLHARHYADSSGFGRDFEAVVAQGLAEFAGRLDNPQNGLWLATEGEALAGSIAIDAEDMAPAAHLRWFIVAAQARGSGLGSALLRTALAFCDAAGFAETHLWTFRGLDAARRLYEAAGFALAEERPGRQWGEAVMEQRFIRPRPA